MMVRTVRNRLLSLLAVLMVIAIGTSAFWQISLSAGTTGSPGTHKVAAGESVASIASHYGVSVASLYAANNLKPGMLLYKGQVLVLAVSGEAPAVTPEPVEEEAAMAVTGPSTYKVESGDTVAGIAAEFGVSVAALRAANNLGRADLLYKGQTLTIPAPGEAIPTPEPVEEEAAMAATGPRTYTVESGDTVAGIAAEFDVSVAALMSANDLRPGDLLYNGKILTIPAPGEVPAAATPEPAEEPAPAAEVEPTPAAEEEATSAPEEEATPVAAEEATPVVEEEVTPVAEEEATPAAEEEATPVVEEEATPAPEEEVTPEATPEPEEEAADEAPLADLVDTAVAAGNFSTLVTALETAGVAELLRGEGPFTVFAPTDEAFAALPKGTLEALLADPTGALLEVLFYHVVAGELRAADVSDGVEVETLQGSSIRFTVVDGAVQVDSATIVAADIEASNGVIHVVDAVLLPPTVSGSGGEPVTSGEPVAPSEEVTATEEITVAVGTVETDAQVDVQVIAVAGAPSASATAWPAPAENVAVFSPVAGGAYHSPIEVNGLARTAEGTVSISLLNAAGEILADRTAAGGAGEEFGFFTSSLRFSVDEPVAAVLNVVELDMAEGTVLTEVRRPVVLLPGQRSVDITYPTPGAVVCGPLTVSGYANTFEANVLLQLRDPDNALLEQLPAMGGTLGVYREFGATFDLGELDAPAAVLVSANESDASGRYLHVDRTVVPVTVYPAGDPACTPS